MDDRQVRKDFAEVCAKHGISIAGCVMMVRNGKKDRSGVEVATPAFLMCEEIGFAPKVQDELADKSMEIFIAWYRKWLHVPNPELN